LPKKNNGCDENAQEWIRFSLSHICLEQARRENAEGELLKGQHAKEEHTLEV